HESDFSVDWLRWVLCGDRLSTQNRISLGHHCGPQGTDELRIGFAVGLSCEGFGGTDELADVPICDLSRLRIEPRSIQPRLIQRSVERLRPALQVMAAEEAIARHCIFLFSRWDYRR